MAQREVRVDFEFRSRPFKYYKSLTVEKIRKCGFASTIVTILFLLDSKKIRMPTKVSVFPVPERSKKIRIAFSYGNASRLRPSCHVVRNAQRFSGFGL